MNSSSPFWDLNVNIFNDFTLILGHLNSRTCTWIKFFSFPNPTIIFGIFLLPNKWKFYFLALRLSNCIFWEGINSKASIWERMIIFCWGTHIINFWFFPFHFWICGIWLRYIKGHGSTLVRNNWSPKHR